MYRLNWIHLFLGKIVGEVSFSLSPFLSSISLLPSLSLAQVESKKPSCRAAGEGIFSRLNHCYDYNGYRGLQSDPRRGWPGLKAECNKTALVCVELGRDQP